MLFYGILAAMTYVRSLQFWWCVQRGLELLTVTSHHMIIANLLAHPKHDVQDSLLKFA